MNDARNTMIGQRVRHYRTARSISLEKMAGAFQEPISGNQLAKYETGQSRWPADLLCEIAVMLKLDIRLLTCMEDGKHEGKDTQEWEAERYKNVLLNMGDRARKIAYKIIDGISSL